MEYEEILPSIWKKTVILYRYTKKGTRWSVISDNHRGLLLLDSAYKIFARIPPKFLIPYVEKFVEDYQC